MNEIKNIINVLTSLFNINYITLILKTCKRKTFMKCIFVIIL